jgi:hypothetical protein
MSWMIRYSKVYARSGSLSPKTSTTDQICVYKEADGARKLCMIIEYKAAHKLSVSNLRAGLQRADQG